MARLIQKTGFISRKSAGDYMKYIATREGVEVLTGKGPTTEKQKELVAKLLKDFPDVRDSFEYEDYKQAPTLHTASALISAALDSHMQNLQSENGYLKYIATRPGAEKHGAHGLFGREDNANLTAAMHDLTSHDGNVWTIIYSLHREDAERLGYNNAAAWRKLLISQQNKFSEAFHIPASALHWYAAYHDADTHPHIHMMIWTDQETVLKRDAVVKLRSAMTNSIFQAELENLYIRKDAAYKDVSEAAREVMRELVDRMESVSAQPASIQQKLLELALELRTVSGKKQYGYEDAAHHNAVFIGTDEGNCPRHAHLRSTNSFGKAFRLNVESSDPRYSFHYNGTDGSLYVFEAPIDMLSYISMNPRQWQKHSYVACCGTSPLPVMQMLKPDTQMVYLCLDNDDAGHKASERMAEQLRERGVMTERLVPELKDWNDDLLHAQKEELAPCLSL